MDAHPIPQDVTGFQFKLIGEMTIKQFAYVASGIILAWVFFSIPISILIKLPFSLFSICTGLALAFLPVEGRPFDLMITYFIKALFMPNQYVFQKSGTNIIPILPMRKISQSQISQPTAISEEKLHTILATSRHPVKNELDKKELFYMQSVSAILDANISQPALNQVQPHIIQSFSQPVLQQNQIQPQIIQPFPKPQQQENQVKDQITSQPSQIQPQEVNNTSEKQIKAEEIQQELEKEVSVLEKELEETKSEIKEEEAKGINNQELQLAYQKVSELEKLLNETALQKSELEKKLLLLQQQFENQTKQPATTVASPVQKTTKDVVKNTYSSPFAETPNLISGIVKDPRKNVLPNILIEIKDKEGNPVRAFKTNKLGQFASATPLANGNYTIFFEDPEEKNKFDSIEIIAKGEIILPLEIVSQDAREELRKALFS